MENLNQNLSSYRKFVKKKSWKETRTFQPTLFFRWKTTVETYPWLKMWNSYSTNMAPMRHNMAWGPNTAAKLLARPRPSFWVPRLHPFIVNLCAVSEPTNPAGVPSSLQLCSPSLNTEQKRRSVREAAPRLPSPRPTVSCASLHKPPIFSAAPAPGALEAASSNPVLALVAA